MSAAIAWKGTSDTGKPGLPNTKLAKKVRWTPLGICASGLKSAIGARPPSHPARQARPPRRSMARESRMVLLPTRSSTASSFLASAIRCDSSGPSVSTRAAPSCSSRATRSRPRVVAMTRTPASTHQRGDLGADGELAAGAGVHQPDALDPDHLRCLGPLASAHVHLGVIEAERFDFNNDMARQRPRLRQIRIDQAVEAAELF